MLFPMIDRTRFNRCCVVAGLALALMACQKAPDATAALPAPAMATKAATATASPITPQAAAAATGIAIQQPWIRATPPRAPAAGGFAVIVNGGDSADTLVSASSPRAARVEVHEMSMDGGVMRMRHLVDGLPIPAHGRVELKSGSYHLMLFDMPQPFVEGQQVPVTLVFAQAGPKQVVFDVRGMTQGMGDDHAGH